MPFSAEAQVATERASQYLTQLCTHLDEKATADGQPRVRVESSDRTATVDFGWGCCAMQASTRVLALRAEAADQQGLDQVTEFVTRHLERYGTADRLRITWRRHGAPAVAPADAGHRLQAMRQFHRRVRH